MKAPSPRFFHQNEAPVPLAHHWRLMHQTRDSPHGHVPQRLQGLPPCSPRHSHRQGTKIHASCIAGAWKGGCLNGSQLRKLEDFILIQLHSAGPAQAHPLEGKQRRGTCGREAHVEDSLYTRVCSIYFRRAVPAPWLHCKCTWVKRHWHCHAQLHTINGLPHYIRGLQTLTIWFGTVSIATYAPALLQLMPPAPSSIDFRLRLQTKYASW